MTPRHDSTPRHTTHQQTSTAPRRRPRRSGQRGSVMMLMPAAVLIVLLLGAISVDSAIVFLAQRQAHNVATDAANDAAGAAIDLEQLRNEGTVVLDVDRARQVARDAVLAADVDGLTLDAVRVEGPDTVAVTVTVEVRRLSGTAFGADRRALSLTVRAQGRQALP